MIMNHFNPLFNSTSFARNTIPFATAGSSFTTKATSTFLSRNSINKVTLSSLLNGAQKTIGTVNQIVPLYNQVKPMVQNSKVLLNVAKGLKFTNKNKRNYRNNNRNYSNETIDIKIKEEIKKEPVENTTKPKTTGPSKPFFL